MSNTAPGGNDAAVQDGCSPQMREFLLAMKNDRSHSSQDGIFSFGDSGNRHKTNSISDASAKLIQALLDTKVPLPEDTFFDDGATLTTPGLFKEEKLRSYATITPLIAPSPKLLFPEGDEGLGILVEGVEKHGENFSGRKQHQPSFYVGFSSSSLLGSSSNAEKSSLFSPIEGVFLPFLVCEGFEDDDSDDNKRKDSALKQTMLASTALFQAAGKIEQLDNELTAFSIRHDCQNVVIHGYYTELYEGRSCYFEHPIVQFNLTDDDGKDKWTSYQFVYNLYHIFAPEQLKRLQEVLEEVDLEDVVKEFQKISKKIDEEDGCCCAHEENLEDETKLKTGDDVEDYEESKLKVSKEAGRHTLADISLEEENPSAARGKTDLSDKCELDAGGSTTDPSFKASDRLTAQDFKKKQVQGAGDDSDTAQTPIVEPENDDSKGVLGRDEAEEDKSSIISTLREKGMKALGVPKASGSKGPKKKSSVEKTEGEGI